jgi:hypothetical protein
MTAIQVVVFVRGLVLRFQEPAHDRLFPQVPGLYTKPFLLPAGRREPVVDLLGFPPVCSPSALL